MASRWTGWRCASRLTVRAASTAPCWFARRTAALSRCRCAWCCCPKRAEAAAAARQPAERASRKDQRKRVDPRTLACADHLILLTSLPPARFTVAQLGALYRLRWQIELLFKRLKSLLHL